MGRAIEIEGIGRAHREMDLSAPPRLFADVQLDLNSTSGPQSKNALDASIRTFHRAAGDTASSVRNTRRSVWPPRVDEVLAPPAQFRR